MTLRRACLALLCAVVLALPALAGDMVEIAVEVTEINATKASELGISWTNTVQGGELSSSLAGRIPEVLPDVPTIIDVADWKRFTPLSAELKLLAERGAAQVLSKPKLITRSGTSAKFLVGGEFPVVATGVTTTSIEWKEYGILTEVTPRVAADGTIELVLTTEVSRLDWANRVKDYPALATRMATSTVRVRSGQTIALAGMLETRKDEKRTGIPLLMDIPVLGHLFSRVSKVEAKTNVLIFVTPRVIE